MRAKKNFLTIVVISVLYLFLGICTSANAEQDIKLYNKGTQIIPAHELFYYNEQYYLNINDLQQLNLSVSKKDSTYTITSCDYFGKEYELKLEPYTFVDVTGGSITPIDKVTALSQTNIETVTCNGTYRRYRTTEKIGYSNDIPINMIDFSFDGNNSAMIKVDGTFYISAQFIGERLSHEYKFQNERMDFYISDTYSAVTEVGIELVKGTVAPEGGFDVKIYTAYKTGMGNTLDDYELLSGYDFTIPEKESGIKCIIETPAEKIIAESIYFIADLGKRYSYICDEYDFSKVGTFLVYGQQNDVKYTVNINLPEIDERDVPFTVYAEADNRTFSKQGVIKRGEKSVSFEFEGLPTAKSYSTKIKFDYHKYKNTVLEDFSFLNIAYAKDFETDFTPQYSRSVICDVSLPEDFVCDGDIDVTVQLSKYMQSNSVAVVDSLTDWTDYKTVTLNNEKRFEQVCLYSQAESSQLSYKLTDNIDGLCEKGYLNDSGKTASSSQSAQKIDENISAELKLLKKKKTEVKVYRPFSMSDENDIFAYVVLYDMTNSRVSDLVMDFTQTPLIAAGTNKSQFEIEIAEDKLYQLEIRNITGDENLFDYCYYVKSMNSPLNRKHMQYFGYSDENLSLTLLKCNSVSGLIQSEDMNLHFKASAVCKLYDGYVLSLSADVSDGKFSFKIPEDTDTYTLNVQTACGKKSYYVRDGVSTNKESDAADIIFEYDEDKNVILEYIVQKPQKSIEIFANSQYNYFTLENISDYFIDGYDVYIAYYDGKGKLLFVEMKDNQALIAGDKKKILTDIDNYKIKKVKVFAWKNGSQKPLADTAELDVNQPQKVENDMSVLKVGDKKAFCIGKEVILNTSPAFIENTMYIYAADFEMLGYKITNNAKWVYIEKDKMKYKFETGKCTAFSEEDNEMYEITSPILLENELLIPVKAVCELFGEKTDFDSNEKRLIINMPFYDIEYDSKFCEAILDVYYKGVIAGYEDNTFRPKQAVSRCEAAVFLSRAMEHEFSDFEFECSDIEADHWAKSYIGICVNEKIFELENDKFRPYDNITVEEAVCAVLKMKGIAFENCFESAAKYGLLTNIDWENSKRDITKGELAQLICNFY